MSPSFDVDVIIVGAGPAGSTAAKYLAQSGVNVLVLEKEKVPRYKPCGGGVTGKVKTLLDVDFSPAVEDTIDRASIAYGKTLSIPIRFESPIGWCVMRDRFDALLTEHAVKAGARVRDNAPVSRVELGNDSVEVTAGGERITARAIIGADGANGVVARAAGLYRARREVAALEAELELPDASVERWRGIWHFDFAPVPWGYGWIFPKAEHLSVGVGTFINGSRRSNLRQLLDHYISSEPTLQGAKRVLLRGHILPLGGQRRRVHAPRVLLTGDAACLVDPLTGEGIFAAVKSGKLAAEEIKRGMESGDLSFPNYSRRIHREFTADYVYARSLAQLFYRVPLPLLRLFSQALTLQASSADLALGSTTYRRSLLNALTRAPHFLMRQVIAKLT